MHGAQVQSLVAEFRFHKPCNKNKAIMRGGEYKCRIFEIYSGCPVLPLFFNIVLEVLVRAISGFFFEYAQSALNWGWKFPLCPVKNIFLSYFKGSPSGSSHVSTSQSVRCCHHSTSAAASASPDSVCLRSLLLASLKPSLMGFIVRVPALQVPALGQVTHRQFWAYSLQFFRPARISQSVMKAA